MPGTMRSDTVTAEPIWKMMLCELILSALALLVFLKLPSLALGSGRGNAFNKQAAVISA